MNLKYGYMDWRLGGQICFVLESALEEMLLFFQTVSSQDNFKTVLLKQKCFCVFKIRAKFFFFFFYQFSIQILNSDCMCYLKGDFFSKF